MPLPEPSPSDAALPGPDLTGYQWEDAACTDAHGYLLPALQKVLSPLETRLPAMRLFDLGCGNGSVASMLSRRGWQVTGVDPSLEGLAQAKKSYPQLDLHNGSAYDDLAGRFGRFPVVVSLEVVEHVYAPRDYAKTLWNLLEPGGTAIISTPYHGYWKNLALALAGAMDAHFTTLWDHGHIKFWSVKTLGILLTEAGFTDIRFLRVGRIPPLAKAMIAIARRPPQSHT